jgi:ribosomal protein L16 Arg81 hydroxylase
MSTNPVIRAPRTDVSANADATLRRLIEPISCDDFFKNRYERAPFFVSRESPDYFQDLLRLKDVDHMLGTGFLSSKTVRLVREGEETSTTEMDRDTVFRHFDEGGTVIFNALQSHWPPLAELCARLEESLSLRMQANVYLTPREGQGFAAHYDTHDVFILQLEGRKVWRIYDDPMVTLPLGDQAFKKTPQRQKPLHGPLREEREVSVGDLIYIPRGFVHEARASNATSMHVTLGLHPVTWGDLFREALGALVKKDVRFRRGLPTGFATQAHARQAAIAESRLLLESLFRDLPVEATIAELARTQRRGTNPVVGGRLLNLHEAERLGPDAWLESRPGLRLYVETRDDVTLVQFSGKTIELPEGAGELLCFIAQRGSFRVSQIPDTLGAPANLTVLRHLVREGVLTVRTEGTSIAEEGEG